MWRISLNAKDSQAKVNKLLNPWHDTLVHAWLQKEAMHPWHASERHCTMHGNVRSEQPATICTWVNSCDHKQSEHSPLQNTSELTPLGRKCVNPCHNIKDSEQLPTDKNERAFATIKFWMYTWQNYRREQLSRSLIWQFLEASRSHAHPSSICFWAKDVVRTEITGLDDYLVVSPAVELSSWGKW